MTLRIGQGRFRLWGRTTIMTLQELYTKIGGDYDSAIRVLRVEKLIDKHIRKFAGSGVVSKLIEAGEAMDETQLFEAAHAAKGVCGNLGLMKLSDLSSDIAEEFRPGNSRKLSDEDVKALLSQIAALYEETVKGIEEYSA